MKELKKAQMGMIAVLAVMLVSIKRRLPEARRLSSGITTLALAGIVLLVAAGGASAAPTPITDCQEITASGEYYLAGNIDGSSTTGVCIYIKADDVILDGKGYYIDGGTPGSCPEIAEFPAAKATCFARPGIAVKGKSNVTIKNVEVKNFCTGILLYGSASINEEHTIENCTVHDNGNPTVDVSTSNFHGIALYKKVCNSTINNNQVYNNTGKLIADCDDNGAGISFRVGCNYNDFTNNLLYKNTLAGMYSKAGGGDCYNYIAYNNVHENGQTGADAGFTGGIRFQCKTTDDNTLEYNIVTDNYGPGIFIGGKDCILRNNTASCNKDANTGPNCRGDGLRIDRDADGGGRNTILYDNTFCNNEHLDLNVQNAAAGTTGDRNTCDTGANYNDAGATGGNVCQVQCPAKPDLVIDTICKIWVTTGATYNVTYNVTNQGGAATSVTTTTGVYIDGQFNATLTVSNGVGVLAANGGTKAYVIGPISLSDTCDDIGLLADYGTDEDECDETNNWGNTTMCKKPKLTVVPPGLCVNPGTFTVDIDVDPNGLPVYGVQYKLTYNTSVIRLDMQNEDDFLKEGSTYETMVTNYDIDNVNGVATYGITRKDTILGQTTAGTLVVLTFQVVGSAGQTSWINLSEVVVSNNESVDIYAELENDSVEICAANQKPDANASSNHLYNNVGSKYLCYGTLNGSESTDPDGKADIFDYVWACGDGQFGVNEILDHIYSSYYATGMVYTPFTATLTVTDSGGLSDDANCTVNVYIAGDANGDCKVNILDASMTGLRWNKKCVDATGVCWGMTLPDGNSPDLWAEMADKADLNNDCEVNILDTSIVGLCWGDTC
jgi:parallel beta-helix repeat protein